MIFFPNCKINLGLHIVEKRSDGYHELETVFYPLPWSDLLEMTVQHDSEKAVDYKGTGIRIYGSKESNLCVRAYQLLAADHTIGPLKIHLHKIIPIGAGLGGGSSDAAFVLKGIDRLFGLGLSDSRLEEYAAKLGSDCPFFIRNRAVYATGRGEKFEDLKLKLDDYFFVVVKPRVHVSTAEAYSGVVPLRPETSLKELIKKPIEKWKDVIRNDFEKTILDSYPSIRKIKKRLYDEGAVYASMSGSGSAVYGIFREKVDLHLHFRSSTCWQGFGGEGMK
ncbi:MAG: 4-(cytidine 5'-diphospho)-2-C-methyl-D-erythritol kinase [Bacteroidota bacterium]